MCNVNKSALSDMHKNVMKRVFVSMMSDALQKSEDMSDKELAAAFPTMLKLANEYVDDVEHAIFDNMAFSEARVHLANEIVQ